LIPPVPGLSTAGSFQQGLAADITQHISQSVSASRLQSLTNGSVHKGQKITSDK